MLGSSIVVGCNALSDCNGDFIGTMISRKLRDGLISYQGTAWFRTARLMPERIAYVGYLDAR